MAPSIGVNLRVTGHCNQGGRRYMEDAFAVAYQQTDDERDLEYAYFGIFDGHGGREAALFAKEHLMNFIVSQKNFWSDIDENVLKAIRDGFVATHMAMWKQVATWPQTVSGLPSTSGTTASVIFIRKGKMYVGHVGDSAIVLGYKDPDDKHYCARPLTSDHKPESPAERKRIEDVGGSVMSKCGVQRVVWNRPRIGHKGPVRRSTHIDQIPFLAVARSLGDLWSYDYFHGQFIVSPEPDVHVMTLDPRKDRCIVLATDGVWNMVSYKEAVRVVEAAEHENECHFLSDETRQIGCKPWVNPSKLLVDRALDLWVSRKKRADNTSVVTVMLDPPGPPKSEVLLRRRMMQKLRPREEGEAVAPLECSDRREQPRVLVTHAQDYVPVEAGIKSEPPSPVYTSYGPCDSPTVQPPSPPWIPSANPASHRPPLPPKLRSVFGAVYPRQLSMAAVESPSPPPPPLQPPLDYSLPEPDSRQEYMANLRRARTPPLQSCEDFYPRLPVPPALLKPASLQRTSRCWPHSVLEHVPEAFAAPMTGLCVARGLSTRVGLPSPLSSSEGHSPKVCTDDVPDVLCKVGDGHQTSPPLPTSSQGWGLCARRVPGCDTDDGGSRVTAACCSNDDDKEMLANGLKRKVPPGGGRATLVVKHSRMCRGQPLPTPCALTGGSADHITRGSVRLRKAQA